MKFLKDEAFQENLVKYVEGVMRRLGVEDRSERLAQDAVQDAMVSILSAVERGSLKEGILSPEGFIKKSVRNGLFSLLRKWQLDAKHGVTYLAEDLDELSAEDVLDHEPGFPVEEGVLLDVKMDSRTIRDFLEKEVFPDTKMKNIDVKRKIFELRVQEGLGFTEIAKIVFENEYDFTNQKEVDKAGDLVRQTYKRIIEQIQKRFPDIFKK